MQGLPSSQSGLGSGLLNTSRLMGGALGLAVLSTIADARTRHDLAAGGFAHALTSGFDLAFTVGAGFSLAGALVAGFLLRPAPQGQGRADGLGRAGRGRGGRADRRIDARRPGRAPETFYNACWQASKLERRFDADADRTVHREQRQRRGHRAAARGDRQARPPPSRDTGRRRPDPFADLGSLHDRPPRADRPGGAGRGRVAEPDDALEDRRAAGRGRIHPASGRPRGSPRRAGRGDPQRGEDARADQPRARHVRWPPISTELDEGDRERIWEALPLLEDLAERMGEGRR